MNDNERALYIISVAAELAGVHPQTLRIYERKGLIEPKRTEGRSRRYSDRDIAVLQHLPDVTIESDARAGAGAEPQPGDPRAPPRGAGQSARGRGPAGARAGRSPGQDGAGPGRRGPAEPSEGVRADRPAGPAVAGRVPDPRGR